jgi:hypothetical protein
MSAIGNGHTQIYYNDWGRGKPVGAPQGVCTLHNHPNVPKEKRLALPEA